MKALITGITGQDGAYLAKFLLEKNYEVIGTFRRSSNQNFWRLSELGIQNHENLNLVELDLTDQGNILDIVRKNEPEEIYNLAAQSFVGVSFQQPITTANITGLGCLNILEAIRLTNKKIKFYQASTSEMFGKVKSVPQNEETDFYPRSPYGVAKLFAHWSTINYRESYNIFASSGILFNHESPLRGKEFVTRKITDCVSKIKLKKLDSFQLGNLDAKRDWGFAGDFVEGMWKILQAEVPSTYVLATGRTETVRDFLKQSFNNVEIDVEFEGSGKDEIVIDKKTKQIYVTINPDFYRPAEVEILIGDANKAKRDLNWEHKTSLEDLCQMMIKADLARNI